MPLTRDFKQTIQARVRRDAAFRKELLREGVECFVLGDIETGKAVLRDYINATVGFPKLAAQTGIHVKTLHQMFGPHGNPTTSHLSQVMAYLQQAEGVRFRVRSARATSRRRKRPLPQGAFRAISRVRSG